MIVTALRLCLALCLCLPAWCLPTLVAHDSTHVSTALPNPVAFIENGGQWPAHVAYATDVPSGKLFLQNNGYTFSFYDGHALQELKHDHHNHHSHPSPLSRDRQNTLKYHAFKVQFLGAQTASIQAQMPLKTVYSYFKEGYNGQQGGLKAYQEITYQSLYPRVGQKWYRDATGQLKYDLLVAPGGRAEAIQMQYQGAERLYVDAQGYLVVQTSVGTLKEAPPVVWQNINGQRKPVACQFNVSGNVVSFSFPAGYQTAYPMVIDPLLVFSTFSGSTADNWGFTACFDEQGNTYSGGIVFGTGFPVTIGAFDEVFSASWDIGIMKFDSTGQELLYAAYLGGTDMETPHSLIVNNQGELLVMGATSSINFPANGFDQTFNGGSSLGVSASIIYNNGTDIFVARISENGNRLLGSTYIGGSDNDGVSRPGGRLVNNYGDFNRGDIIVDSQDRVYVASFTSSNNFPVANAAQGVYGGGNLDAVVFSLSANLQNLRWATYYGGSVDDAAYSIKLDSIGQVYIAGGTRSFDLPMPNNNALNTAYEGVVDAFVALFSSTGNQLVTATFLNTNRYEQAYFIDLDPQGNVYAMGQTQGDYPVTPGVYFNRLGGQFIHKLTPGLDSTYFSTTFGSASNVTAEPDISPTAFLVNDCGSIYISGWGGNVNASENGFIGGSTSNMPITDDAFQRVTDGSDFYLMVLAQDASELLYATYFGGQAAAEHVDGGTSRFDKRGLVYQAVCAGCGGISDFPTSQGSYSLFNGSGNCNNAVFKFDLASLRAGIQTYRPNRTEPGYNGGCVPLTVLFENTSVGGISYEWDFGDGSALVNTTNQNDINHTFTAPGVYTVTLTAVDQNTCEREDRARVTITVGEENFTVAGDATICQGESVPLQATGATNYDWFPRRWLSSTTIGNPVATPDSTITYYVTMRNEAGCEVTDSVTIEVEPFLEPDFTIERIADCQNTRRIQLTATGFYEGQSVTWSLGDGTTSTELSFVHEYEQDGTYNITFSTAGSSCRGAISKQVTVSDLVVPNVFSPNGDGLNETFVVDYALPLELRVYNRWGKEIYRSETYDNSWGGKGLPAHAYFYVLLFENTKLCEGWVSILR